jgi:hypothetical protein
MNITAYHVTSRANAMSILKEGFQGDYGDAGFGAYLWTCEQAAQNYAEQGGWDGSLEDAVIVEVELPESDLEMVDPDPNWPNPEDYENVALVRLDEFDDEARWKPLRMIADETGEFILEVSVAKLREMVDPLATPPWGSQGSGLTEAMVRDAMRFGDTIDRPVNNGFGTNAETHAGRIGHLALHGWDDEITLELSSDDRWPVTDGNHRFYAAIIRGDETLLATAVGDLEKMQALRPDPQPATPALAL